MAYSRHRPCWRPRLASLCSTTTSPGRLPIGQGGTLVKRLGDFWGGPHLTVDRCSLYVLQKLHPCKCDRQTAAPASRLACRSPELPTLAASEPGGTTVSYPCFGRCLALRVYASVVLNPRSTGILPSPLAHLRSIFLPTPAAQGRG